MRKVAGLLLVLLLFLPSFSFAQFAQTVTATRTLPVAYQPGSSLTVTLNLEVDEANLPNAVIVTEYVPVGWNLVTADPVQSRFLPETGEIKWEFHDVISDTSMDISYQLQIPEQASGARTFQGTCRWIDVSNYQYETAIGGEQFTSDGQPFFYNLQFFNQDGQALNASALAVDIPIKVTGQYLSPLNTPAASSSWEIRCANNETIVFATSVTSGQVNAAWIGSCILQPETSYIIRVQATDSAGRSSQPAEAAITTVPRSQTEDTDGNGIPDQQEPAGEDLSHYGYNPDLPLPQDTKIISFHDKAVLLESPDGYPVTYFSGMEAENLPDFLRAPYGVFLSRVEVPEGQTVRLRFIFPEVLPGGSRWYKYDESAAATQRWQEYSQVEMTGNVAIVTLTDGGSGDADGVANGVIVDPSGPVVRSADSGGCFIATAAFGSPLSKEIEVLRLFRDRVLCPTEVGRAFVTWYYRKGPAAASFISRKGWLRAIVRLMLYPVVWLAALFLKGLLPYLMVGFWLLTILRSKYRRLTKSTR